MGNIKSFCCKDSASDIDDREERSRILNDNCGGSSEDVYHSNNSALSHQDNVSYGSTDNGNNNKTVEQSALDRIYQRMAANVIDVAPGESMIMQQAEFLERQKAYQYKLNQIKAPLALKLTHRMTRHVNSNPFDGRLNTSSPSTNVNPANNTVNNLSPSYATINTSSSPQHLSKEKRRPVEFEPISSEDILLMNEVSKRSVQAIKSLKINSKEQVVTQFKP